MQYAFFSKEWKWAHFCKYRKLTAYKKRRIQWKLVRVKKLFFFWLNHYTFKCNGGVTRTHSGFFHIQVFSGCDGMCAELTQNDPRTILIGKGAGLDHTDAVLGESLSCSGPITLQLPFFLGMMNTPSSHTDDWTSPITHCTTPIYQCTSITLSFHLHSYIAYAFLKRPTSSASSLTIQKGVPGHLNSIVPCL